MTCPFDKIPKDLTPETCSNRKEQGCKIGLECSDCLHMSTVNGILALRRENAALKEELALCKQTSERVSVSKLDKIGRI